MLENNFKPFDLKKFNIKTLEIKSDALKGNPLGDSSKRLLPVLIPKEPGEYNCVYYLSGFTGNAQKNFNFKSFEKNFVEEIDEWTEAEAIAPKIYIFIDAWTAWGGSQFINSEGCGRYEDYIVQDIVPNLKKELERARYKISDNIVMGGSSGGYGALHLSSKFPEIFSHCLAVAPDCDFEVSLKSEIYHALADIDNQGGVRAILDKIVKFEAKTKQRSFHAVVNVLAMAACYSRVDSGSMPILPLSKEKGFDEELWKCWLEKDPIHFLPKRIENIKKLKTIFLSVGEFDQFVLQYGLRKIKNILEAGNIDFIYEEFRGNHFDIGTRRKKALSLV